MTVSFRTEHRQRYSVVRVEGDPTLAEFLDLMSRLEQETRRWPIKRALVDLRSVRTLTRGEEHRVVGRAAASHLSHLDRVASVVPADRITRESEAVAQAAGLNLRVFANEGEAIAWLL